LAGMKKGEKDQGKRSKGVKRTIGLVARRKE
jgi:hypothetical protein